MTDDDEIEQALRRIALGHGNELDHWRAKVARRREQREQRDDGTKLDTIFVNDEPNPAAVQLFDSGGELDAAFTDLMTDVIDGVRKEFGDANEQLLENVARLLHGWMQRQAAENNRTRELEQTIGELRGELKVVRSLLDDERSNNVIDVPRNAWRHDAA